MPDTEDISNFAVDGMTPERVVRPTTLEQLSTELSLAHANGDAVIPWGGGTQMHIGNLPERYTVALDMTGLSGNIQHEPGDLTVFADAGVTIAELQQTLERAGQRLPFDVARPELATLGGSVASNTSGQLRSSLGGIRDWVIGMKFMLPDGKLAKSGGRVVKNVQGYDLHRLHVGAFGTLGMIVEVALKVVPVAAKTSTVAAWFESVPEAGEYVMQIYNGPVQPEAITMFAGSGAEATVSSLSDERSTESPVLVLSRVAGGPNAVARMETDLTGAAGALGAAGYEVVREKDAERLWSNAASDPGVLTARATFKPRQALLFLEDVSNALGESGFHGELQAGFGTVSISTQEADRKAIDTVRDAGAKHAAVVVIEHCPAELKSRIDVFGATEDSLELMRSVKHRFDPHRVLNPGRFAGGI